MKRGEALRLTLTRPNRRPRSISSVIVATATTGYAWLERLARGSRRQPLPPRSRRLILDVRLRSPHQRRCPGLVSPHVHGVVAEQLLQGLAGPLSRMTIGVSLSSRPTSWCSRTSTSPTAHRRLTPRRALEYMTGSRAPWPTGPNGLRNPELRAAPGQVQRWRLVNASTSRFITLCGHTLSVIGGDGGLLEDRTRARACFWRPVHAAAGPARAGGAPHGALQAAGAALLEVQAPWVP